MITKEEKKRLSTNFFSLSFLQGANHLLGLITLPYLVRVLGVDYIGLLAFASTIIIYFQIFIDYGFNITATKEISIHRNNKPKLIEIYSAIMFIKICLLIISFLLLTILVFSFDMFSKDALVYFLTFGTLVGQVFLPLWLFQGMERMKFITYLSILSKVIFTMSIYVFVKEDNDFILVPILTSFGFLVSGTWSLYLVKKDFGIKFDLQKIHIIIKYLTEGFYVFLSRFYVSLYNNTNTLLLGFFTNISIVGYYSIAEKIVLAICGIFEPINQTLFPFLAQKYKEDYPKFVSLIKKIVILFLLISFLICILSEFFRYEIVYFVTGKYNLEVLSILSIFFFRIMLFPFGPLFSNALIIMGRKREFMKVMNFTVILDFILVPLSIYFYGVYGLVCSFIFVLLVHVLLLFFYFKKSIRLKIN
jgi:PST family polysaccharide transporter